MAEGHQLVVRRSLIVWIGTGLLVSLDVMAAGLQELGFTYLVLALTGLFALFGIGFGIWAGLTATGKLGGRRDRL